MPTQDGTGPIGQGPMTGRGLGPCGGGRGFGRGYGGGMGRRGGFFRGMMRGFWPYPASPDDEKQYLKDEIDAMEKNLKDAKKHLSGLEKGEK